MHQMQQMRQRKEQHMRQSLSFKTKKTKREEITRRKEFL